MYTPYPVNKASQSSNPQIPYPLSSHKITYDSQGKVTCIRFPCFSLLQAALLSSSHRRLPPVITLIPILPNRTPFLRRAYRPANGTRPLPQSVRLPSGRHEREHHDEHKQTPCREQALARVKPTVWETGRCETLGCFQITVYELLLVNVVSD